MLYRFTSNSRVYNQFIKNYNKKMIYSLSSNLVVEWWRPVKNRPIFADVLKIIESVIRITHIEITKRNATATSFKFHKMGAYVN